jgi:hypothetical protein
MSVKEAARELSHAVQAGKLIAFGRTALGAREPVERTKWLDYAIWLKKDLTPYVALNEPPWSEEFKDIRFERPAVLALWPEREPVHMATARAETAACMLFVEHMTASPTIATMTREDAIEQAKAEIPKLSGRAGRRAWDTAIQRTGAIAWRKPGPRKRRA